jgi:hypothetical protein
MRPEADTANLSKTHPKTAQFLSDPINASVTQDDIARLKAIEDVMTEGVGEPGLFSKKNRDSVISALRQQGYQIEQVEQPKGVFSKTLERTVRALIPQAPEIASLRIHAIGRAYVPPSAVTAMEQAPTTTTPTAQKPAEEPIQIASQPAGFFETLARNVARGSSFRLPGAQSKLRRSRICMMPFGASGTGTHRRAIGSTC